MLKIQNIFFALACLLLFTGWKKSPTNSFQVNYSAPTILENSQNMPLVESLPLIVDENTRTGDSILFENDRLIVRKTLVEAEQVGEEVIYDITLEILKDIKDLWIEERIPESFKVNQVIPAIIDKTSLIWHFKDLKSGDTQAIAFNLTPLNKGTHEVETLVRFEEALNLTLYSGQPNLEIDLISPDSVERNTSKTWEVTLKNTGTAVAKSVKLSAKFSEAFKAISPVEYSLQTLDVGASRNFSFEAEASAQGLFENNFHATYLNSVSETEATRTANTKIVQSNIEIEALGPPSAYVFKPQSYKINILNTGDTDLENVRITQMLSDNYSIIDSGRGLINRNAIGWMIPKLPAGKNQSITTRLTSNRPGKSIVKTILKTKNGITSSDQISTEWLAVPGVTLSIVDSKDPITIGETTELNIRVRNQGEFEPVNGKIEISFSEHLKPLSILNDIEGTISGNSIFIPEVLLQPGKDVIVNIAAEGIQMGSGRTNLNFIADFLNNPVINQESTNIY